MLLVGPSKLSHKLTHSNACTHAHTQYKHTHTLKQTHTQTKVEGAQLWPCGLSNQIDSIMNVVIDLHTLLKKRKETRYNKDISRMKLPELSAFT